MGATWSIRYLRDIEEGSHLWKMIEIAKHCDKAGVSLPVEVDAYFASNNIDWDGEVDDHFMMESREMKYIYQGDSDDTSMWFREDSREGWRIHVKTIPKGVSEIVVSVGW